MNERWARQVVIPEISPAGQARLGRSRVAVVGLGALGCAAATVLARAGVGHLTLIDPDTVTLPNLHRQTLYADADIGRLKVQVAAERLRAAAPDLDLRLVPSRLDGSNAIALLSAHDIIADCTDNLAARYLVSDAAVILGVEEVMASALRFEGQLTVLGGEGPCYRCLFPVPPPPAAMPDCATAGVLGSVPGTLGAMQAGEVIKRLLGIGRPLVGRLLLHDALNALTSTVKVGRDPACRRCGPAADLFGLGLDAEAGELDSIELEDLLATDQPPLILDLRTPWEVDQSPLPGGLHIPIAELEARVAEIPRDRSIVAVCAHGVRSVNAAFWLALNGFRVRSLRGGLEVWRGLPVTRQ